MPLPSGTTLANAETSAAVQQRVGRAMEELAAKAERQRMEAEVREAARARREEEEREARELEAVRQARLAKMRRDAERQRGLAPREIRTISQDELLPTVLADTHGVVHFFARGFEQCDVMDVRLGKLAGAHPETVFVRIEAEKAPFFVERFAVRTLPTLMAFEEGKLLGKQIGFVGVDQGLDPVKGLERALDALGVLDASPSGGSAAAATGGRRLVDNDDDDDDDE